MESNWGKGSHVVEFGSAMSHAIARDRGRTVGWMIVLALVMAAFAGSIGYSFGFQAGARCLVVGR